MFGSDFQCGSNGGSVCGRHEGSIAVLREELWTVQIRSLSCRAGPPGRPMSSARGCAVRAASWEVRHARLEAGTSQDSIHSGAIRMM